MIKKYIYMEPIILGYGLEKHSTTINKHNTQEVKDFITQLRQVMELIKMLKYKVIISSRVLEAVCRHNPIIPFDLSTVNDPRIRSIAKTLHSQLKIFISNVAQVELNSSCSLENKLINKIDEIEEFYFDFLELLISGCSIHSNIRSNLILKDVKSKIFTSDTYKLSCDASCKQIFENEFKCLDHYELKKDQRMIISKNELLEVISNIEPTPHFSAKQNDHHTLFGNKIRSMDDILNPEKSLLISLNRIADIKEVTFREFLGTTSKEPASLYDWNELEYHEKDYCNIKATLSLKSRSNKPAACKVEIILHREAFEKLESYTHASGITILTADVLDKIC